MPSVFSADADETLDLCSKCQWFLPLHSAYQNLLGCVSETLAARVQAY